MNNKSTENSQNSFFQEMDYLLIGGGVFLFFLIFGYYDFKMYVGAVYNEGQAAYAALPRGMDYKAVYNCGAALWSGLGEYLKITSTGYPPLVTVLYLPLNLFPVDAAYKLFVFLLMLCGAATVYISMTIQRHSLTVLSRIALSLVICTILFFTYPFNFSFERGNGDIIAAGFAAGALLATAQGKKWPAILLLTLSSQIKVYPAILSVFLLARFGWGSLTSFISLNICCLFILGPNAFLGFIKGSGRLSTVVFSWPGNHSFHSYVVNLYKTGFFSKSVAERILALAYFLSAASFIALSFKYVKSLPWRRNNKEFLTRSFGPREIGIIGASFCLMSLLPPTSHDYKLVIHIVPYIILLNTRKGGLFENEIGSRFFITVVSAFTAYLYIPRFTVMPLQFLFNAFPVMEMKTPALVFLFLSYAYLAIRGHEAGCKALLSRSLNTQ